MGAMKGQAREKKEAAHAKRLAERRKNRGSGQTASYPALDAGALVRLLYLATTAGAQATFGYTRDFGAYTLKFWYDGESEVVYIRPTEDAEAVLRDWSDFFLDELRDGKTPGDPPPPDLLDAVIRALEGI